MKIKKRDGTIVDYEESKVRNAITKALQSSNEDIPEQNIEMFLAQIPSNAAAYTDDSILSVETIQNLVENFLMMEKCFKSAKNFILYREEHKNIRFLQERIDYIQKYINTGDNAASSSETDDNANVILKNVANLNGVFKEEE